MLHRLAVVFAATALSVSCGAGGVADAGTAGGGTTGGGMTAGGTSGGGTSGGGTSGGGTSGGGMTAGGTAGGGTAGGGTAGGAGAPDGGPTFVFFSDWSTALGGSDAALRDTSKAIPWTLVGGQGVEVVPASGLGFPTTNVLRVTALQASAGFSRIVKTGLAIPAPSESMWLRWYYRNEQPSLGDNSQHPIESGQTGGLDWSFNVEVQSNTTWRPEFRPPGDQFNPTGRWLGPLLTTGVTYRFELQIEKLSQASCRFHVRVYDAAGQLIASDPDFTNNHWGGNTSLASNPTLAFSTDGGSQLNELRAGCNGIGGTDWNPSILFAYQGAFAVCRSTWCGPYANGH